MNSLISQPQILSLTELWVAVSKPSGWLTIPPSSPLPNLSSTPPILSDWIRSQTGPCWVIHRIDRETSGVLLFARSAEAHRQANTWFQKREVQKTYVCLASGKPLFPQFKISDPIQGAPCTTLVRVLKTFDPIAFWAEISPKTGRRHQIRKHLAAKGFPLLGDPLYGGPQRVSQTATRQPSELLIPRVALHAQSLKLPTGERFEAPLPPDFQSWLDALHRIQNSPKPSESLSHE